MKRFVIALSLFCPLWGCSSISIHKAEGPVPDGVRVCPPQVLLMVDAEADGGRGRSSLVVVPNVAEAYDVRPVTIFAENDFRIDLEDGMLVSLRSAQDTTAILSLFERAGEVGASALAGEGVSARHLEGSYGLPTGIYLLKPDWTLASLPHPSS